MSFPDFISRTLANNKEFAERASRVGKAPIPPGLPPAHEVVAAIDGVFGTGNFYTLEAQDAVARLAIVREQFAAAMSQPNGK